MQSTDIDYYIYLLFNVLVTYQLLIFDVIRISLIRFVMDLNGSDVVLIYTQKVQ